MFPVSDVFFTSYIASVLCVVFGRGLHSLLDFYGGNFVDYHYFFGLFLHLAGDRCFVLYHCFDEVLYGGVTVFYGYEFVGFAVLCDYEEGDCYSIVSIGLREGGECVRTWDCGSTMFGPRFFILYPRPPATYVFFIMFYGVVVVTVRCHGFAG